MRYDEVVASEESVTTDVQTVYRKPAPTPVEAFKYCALYRDERFISQVACESLAIPVGVRRSFSDRSF